MRFTSLFPLACLLLLAVLSTAWQFSGLQMAHGQLLPRADEETTTEAESATTGSTATAEETASATTSSEDKSETKESETTSGTRTSTATQTGNSTTTTKHKTTSVDPRLPAGGISMITPNALSTTYYKIGDPITFVWNYTSLSITPSAINVIASCSLNSATYTIASNVSVEQTQSVTWDTGKFQANATAPLLTATYTLIVYDDSKEIGDIAKAGELSSQTRYYFGMYSPQPYTPLPDFVCPTCSGALSATELQAIKFAVGMAAITIASFTWFAGGFGVFST